MIKKSNLRYISVILVIVLYACTGSSEDGDNEFYSNDKSKLGIQIVDKDLGLQFYPPKDWILMPSSLSKKIEARKGITSTSDNFIYQPTYVFYDDSTKGILSIGKVNSNDTTLTHSAKMNYYKNFISAKYKKNELAVNNFTNGNISFTRFKFKKESLISLKLIFENSKKEIIQMDYTILAGYQNSMEDYIRSSIGSIKLF